MKYLTISEFAKFSGMSRKTLIYYDKIDLLKPEHYGDNKYRYYTFQQIDIAYSIQTLRMLDLSIEEIKVYLSSMNLSRAESLFTEKLAELDQKKRDIENLEYYLKDRIQLVKQSKGIEMNTLFYQTLSKDEHYLQSVPFSFKGSSIYATDEFEAFYDYLVECDIFLGYNMALRTYEDPTTIAYLMRLTTHDRKTLNPKQTLVTRSKGDYLAMYYKGDVYANYRHEQTLMAYALSQNLEIEKTFMHEMIADEIISLDEGERISKISVKIINKSFTPS